MKHLRDRRLKKVLACVPHDEVAHQGQAFSKTGYVKGCKRCQALKRNDNGIVSYPEASALGKIVGSNPTTG